MKTLSLAILLLILAVPLAAQTEQQKSQIKTDVLAVMSEQVSAWNRGDVEGFMRGYWNSDQLVFASGDTVTRGWQPTVERYKKNYATKAAMGTLTFSDTEVTVLSKDAAVVLGSWALAREKDNPKGKFTLIFRRFKDGWKIVHDHTS